MFYKYLFISNSKNHAQRSGRWHLQASNKHKHQLDQMTKTKKYINGSETISTRGFIRQ